MTRSDVRHTGRAPEDIPLDGTEDATGHGPEGGSASTTVISSAPDDAPDGSRAADGAAVDGVGGSQAGRWAAVDPRRTSTRAIAAVIVLLTAVMLVVAYAGKARCVGPTFDDKGRTTPDYDIRIDRDLCYSDIQYLWLDRDIDKHVFPYVHGGITPPPDSKLTGGTVEYPVLTGLLMWAGAFFAHNDGEFLLYSALLMAPPSTCSRSRSYRSCSLARSLASRSREKADCAANTWNATRVKSEATVTSTAPHITRRARSRRRDGAFVSRAVCRPPRSGEPGRGAASGFWEFRGDGSALM